MYDQARNQKFFMEGEVFVKLGHFNKHFVKNSRKNRPAGKMLEFFRLDAFKTTFSMENLT